MKIRLLLASLGLGIMTLTGLSTSAQVRGPMTGSLCSPGSAGAQDALSGGSVAAQVGALARSVKQRLGMGQNGHGPGGAYDLSSHQTLSRVVLLIRENYVEPDRIKPYEMFLAALDYIQRQVPEVMVDDAGAPSRIVVSVGTASQTFELGALGELWEVTMALRDVFHFLEGHIPEAERRRDIEYAAINGMLSCLDPHSILLKPENFDEVKLSTRGEFGGLGIVISIRDGGLTIIAPIEGTPAGMAGLRAKDKIVKIGEESTINMALDEAVQILRGPPDTKVSISVQRRGWTEAREFVLNRAIIKIESVTSELLEDGIGYVKIKSFQGNTFDDLQAHLTKLTASNHNKPLTGLVLDMRNNPGGLLDQAILVSDRFISHGPLVITVGEGNRRREVKNARLGPDEDTYPIAVLLNGGSASASEIVAGALKNHNRAIVIGGQSFGKGSVQVLYDFKDRSALKLTIAQYLTPGDISIQSVGIVPDVAVIPAVVEKDGIHLFVDDDAPREKDLQHHLSQHGPASLTTSAIRINHLSAQERADLDPNSTQESTRDEEIATGKFEYDFEVHLAHDVLRATHSRDRLAMVQETLPLLRARLAEEEALVGKRMGELGVDWRPSPKASSADGAQPSGAQPQASAKVVLEVSSESPQGAPIVAGKTLTLRGVVTNTGDTPLYQVYGVSQSDNPLLRSLEFAFGYLAPKACRTWSVQIKLPADLPARADSVTLQLGDADKRTEALRGQALVNISAQEHPNFAFAAAIDDSAGNGDGLLQPGESVALAVDVTNLGPGAAEDVTVTLKNLAHSHIFLDSGRAKVGPLAVGESKRATLRFRVQGAGVPLKAAAPNAQNSDTEVDEPDLRPRGAPLVAGDDVAFKLAIWDSALSSSLAQTLHFAVAAPARPESAPKAVRLRSGEPVPVYAGANLTSSLLGSLDAQTVTPVRALWGNFVALDLPGGKVGFVAKKDWRKTNGPAVKIAAQAWHLAAPVGAPELNIERPSLVTNDAVYGLHGIISSVRPLKDAFVFVDDKKVFFRALTGLKKHHDLYSYVLDVPLHLKPGVNSITVIARENDDLMARRFFSLLRQPAPVPEPVPTAAPSAPKAP